MKIRNLVGAAVVAIGISVALPVAAGATGGGTEHFKLVFSSENGPGAIFASGVFNAGGTDYQHSRADEAVFPDGTFKIDHSAIHTTFQFNAKACKGQLSGTGPYKLGGGFGVYAGIKGSGTATLNGSIQTGRKANGKCDFHTVSAFVLIVHASGPVTL